MEIIWRAISWEVEGGVGGKIQGLRCTSWQVQNRQGDIKNSIGNKVAKEPMHDPWTWTIVEGLPEGVWGTGCREAKGKKLG